MESEISSECNEKECERKKTQVVVIEGQLERYRKERENLREIKQKSYRKRIKSESSKEKEEDRQLVSIERK